LLEAGGEQVIQITAVMEDIRLAILDSALTEEEEALNQEAEMA